MTSKELLEHIRNAPSFMGGDTRYEATTNSPDLYLEDIAQIEKDLEVLDILKKHFFEEYKITSGPNSLLFRINCTPEYGRVKEWLEND